MIWRRFPILTNRPVCSAENFTVACSPPTSAPYDPESLCAAQYIHIQWHRPHCSQSFPACNAIWPRNHPGVQRPSARRSRAPSLRHCRRRVHRHAQGWHGPNNHRVGREVRFSIPSVARPSHRVINSGAGKTESVRLVSSHLLKR